MSTIKNSKRNRSLKSLPNFGFTIVELLIVIVIIGILAAIVIVAYNGITTSARKTSAISELKQWHKLFQIYKAQFGEYPDPGVVGGGPSTDVWCLGTGFPEATCQSIVSGSPYRVAESTGANIMIELAKVGTPPTNTDKWVVAVTNLGPFLRYDPLDDSNSRVETIIEESPGATAAELGSGRCPDGTTPGYRDDTKGRQHCYIELD